MSNESACSAKDRGSIPGSERSPREGNSNPLQYSCLVGYSPWGLKELNMTKHINSIIKPELEKERKKNKIQIPPNNKFTFYNF